MTRLIKLINIQFNRKIQEFEKKIVGLYKPGMSLGAIELQVNGRGSHIAKPGKKSKLVGWSGTTQ